MKLHKSISGFVLILCLLWGLPFSLWATEPLGIFIEHRECVETAEATAGARGTSAAAAEISAEGKARTWACLERGPVRIRRTN